MTQGKKFNKVHSPFVHHLVITFMSVQKDNIENIYFPIQKVKADEILVEFDNGQLFVEI